MIDRRGMRLESKEGLDDIVIDRFRFDTDDDEDEVPIFVVDPYDISSMRYRSKISGSHQYQSQVQAAHRRQQPEGTSTEAQGNAVSSGPTNHSRQHAPD